MSARTSIPICNLQQECTARGLLAIYMNLVIVVDLLVKIKTLTLKASKSVDSPLKHSTKLYFRIYGWDRSGLLAFFGGEGEFI